MPFAALARLRRRFLGGAPLRPPTAAPVLDARTQYVFSELQKAILAHLPSLEPNGVVGHKSDQLKWEGFSHAEDEWRWSEGKCSSVSFAMPPSCPPTGVLRLDIDVFRRQSITIELNGKRIFSGKRRNGRNRIDAPFDNMNPGRNRLVFRLPNATVAGKGDGRIVAIAIRTLRFETLERPSDPVRDM
jgi:hypothetical protein